MTFARRHRRDGNHSALADTFARLGWLVKDISQGGDGCGDLLLWRADKGFRLVEVKALGTSRGRTLTPAQVRDVHKGWPVDICRSLDDAVNL